MRLQNRQVAMLRLLAKRRVISPGDPMPAPFDVRSWARVVLDSLVSVKLAVLELPDRYHITRLGYGISKQGWL